jgi:hypothetical protein
MHKLSWIIVALAAGCAAPHSGHVGGGHDGSSDLGNVDMHGGGDMARSSLGCNPGYSKCGSMCILVTQCCTANDCPQSPNSMATCTQGRCSISCNGGFKLCNGGCIKSDLCCTDSDCGPQSNTQATACDGTTGQCHVTMCKPGYYDIDGQYADGCECKDGGRSRACTSASDLGPLPLGSSLSVSGNLPETGAANWFTMTFQGDGQTTYHPKVWLSNDPNGQFRFDVFADCNGGGIACGEGNGSNATGVQIWEVYQSGGDSTGTTYQATPAVGSGGTVKVHVYRVSSPVTCDSYTLTITN